MDKLKRQAYIRIGIIIFTFILSVYLSYSIKSIFLKIPFMIIAVLAAFILIRMYIAYKRKKLDFTGRLLAITPPKRKIGKWCIILQNGKVSKKFYTLQRPDMKKGSMYVVIYEDKSFNILEYQEAKFQMAGMKGIKKNPKFKM